MIYIENYIITETCKR